VPVALSKCGNGPLLPPSVSDHHGSCRSYSSWYFDPACASRGCRIKKKSDRELLPRMPTHTCLGCLRGSVLISMMARHAQLVAHGDPELDMPELIRRSVSQAQPSGRAGNSCSGGSLCVFSWSFSGRRAFSGRRKGRGDGCLKMRCSRKSLIPRLAEPGGLGLPVHAEGPRHHPQVARRVNARVWNATAVLALVALGRDLRQSGCT